jgi:hypothetical protein
VGLRDPCGDKEPEASAWRSASERVPQTVADVLVTPQRLQCRPARRIGDARIGVARGGHSRRQHRRRRGGGPARGRTLKPLLIIGRSLHLPWLAVGTGCCRYRLLQMKAAEARENYVPSANARRVYEWLGADAAVDAPLRVRVATVREDAF